VLVEQYPFRHIVTDNLWDPVQSEPALVGAASGAFRSPHACPAGPPAYCQRYITLAPRFSGSSRMLRWTRSWLAQGDERFKRAAA
jgi:hypothetical protein